MAGIIRIPDGGFEAGASIRFVSAASDGVIRFDSDDFDDELCIFIDPETWDELKRAYEANLPTINADVQTTG